MAKKKGLLENTVGKVVGGAVKGVDNLLDFIVSPLTDEPKKTKSSKKVVAKTTQKVAKAEKPISSTKTTITKSVTVKQTTTIKSGGSKTSINKKK